MTNLGDYIWQGTWLTFPLYPYISQSSKQTYQVNLFREMQHRKVSFNDFQKIIDSYVNWRMKTLGTTYVNENVYLMRENQRFAFMCVSTARDFKHKAFVLWDDNNKYLGEFEIEPNDYPSDEFISWIEDTTSNYLKGLISCSDCGKMIKQSDIAGRYFAGIYCKDCWNKTWAKIAERETYD
jgi:hypothetical protein